MIYSLQGKVQELSPTATVIDVAGVGYFVGVSLQTSKELISGANAFLYIQHILREDASLLFGFHSKSEREMFRLLISVNGVGPSSAMVMLSSLSQKEIAEAILSGNSGLLQKVKGIGVKTAQRIIVDLRDKMSGSAAGEVTEVPGGVSPVKEEALSALEVLGIPKKTAERLADRYLKEQKELSTEQLVKLILQNL